LLDERNSFLVAFDLLEQSEWINEVKDDVAFHVAENQQFIYTAKRPQRISILKLFKL
jgi:hypothetical protein